MSKRVKILTGPSKDLLFLVTLTLSAYMSPQFFFIYILWIIMQRRERAWCLALITPQLWDGGGDHWEGRGGGKVMSSMMWSAAWLVAKADHHHRPTCSTRPILLSYLYGVCNFLSWRIHVYVVSSATLISLRLINFHNCPSMSIGIYAIHKFFLQIESRIISTMLKLSGHVI